MEENEKAKYNEEGKESGEKKDEEEEKDDNKNYFTYFTLLYSILLYFTLRHLQNTITVTAEPSSLLRRCNHAKND
jgi:hypothetical protein